MLDEKELEKERLYLNDVQDTIDRNLNYLEMVLEKNDKVLRETSAFIANSFYEMDGEEVATQQGMIEKIEMNLMDFKRNVFVLQKQKQSPYFGRIDFLADDEKMVGSYYIGIANLLKEERPIPQVLDWRAPVCSLYYDYELGRAKYIAPIGQINGNIFLKRQYKTDGRNLNYAFNSSLTIGDDILKQALGFNADNKMKTIVATIQAEQNKIIRSDENVSLLVQGVAGSGKTSIALHRVAYLLYKNKISSQDIAIISPGSLFSDYISGVLPELGESNTPKITFEEIAVKELDGLVYFENKAEMLEDLINGNKQRTKEVEFKSSFEFYNKLKDYFLKYFNVSFRAKDIVVGKKVFKASEINELYNDKYVGKNPATRIEWIADYLIDQLDIAKQNESSVFLRIKKVLLTMFENSDITELYKEFLKTLGLELRLNKIKEANWRIGYEDIPAILYIKDYLIGIESQNQIKHIVIDEMQDYSPIVFDLFNKIYTCPKTILGDIYQCIEKTQDENYLKELSELVGGRLLNLNITYRATVEIAEYTQKLAELKSINNFVRHGENVREYKDKARFYDNLLNEINLLSEKYEKIAIITASTSQSEILQAVLSPKLDVRLVDAGTGEVGGKINILPCVFAKGLEFDAVIFINEKSDIKINKKIAYVACTRALHELVIM